VVSREPGYIGHIQAFHPFSACTGVYTQKLVLLSSAGGEGEKDQSGQII